MLQIEKPDKRIIIFIVAVPLVFIFGAWFNIYAAGAVKDLFIKPNDLENDHDQSIDDPAADIKPDHFINILLLGLDEHGFSDLILIASYNRKTHQTILIFVPRNTFVSDQTWWPKGKARSHISYAHYFGIGEEEDYHRGALQTAYWIELLLGIQIHEYAGITYESFGYLIDRIGGVEIYIDSAFEGIVPHYDEVLKEPLPTGLQRLNGDQTLVYSRYRGHHQYEPRIPEPGSPSQDGDRIIRNQRLLKAIYKQVRSLKMLELIPILRELPDHVHTSFKVWDITGLAPVVYKFDINDLTALVLPGDFIYDYEEQTYYYYLDFEKSHALLREHGLRF